MKKNEPLPAGPWVTPTTKEEAHDRPVSGEEVVALGLMSASDWAATSARALAVFRFGQAEAAKRGLILVDTKYEMGKRPDGTIVVIDEIHTPDSSRYWLADTYDADHAAGREPEGLDKEYVRRWLAGVGFKGDGPIPAIPDDVRIEASRRYVEACEMIRGEPFRVDLSDPGPRMADNLKRAGIWKA
jgi:phosphoribosylaminoimidazole-succinocarboxamide synthase